MASEKDPTATNVSPMPSVIADPTPKSETEELEEQRKDRNFEDFPSSDPDNQTEISEIRTKVDELSSAAADHFADNIRPSWEFDEVSLEEGPEWQNGSSEIPDAYAKSANGFTPAETDLQVDFGQILEKSRYPRKKLLWGGGAAIIILTVVGLTIATQEEEKTQLWTAASNSKTNAAKKPTTSEKPSPNSAKKEKKAPELAVQPQPILTASLSKPIQEEVLQPQSEQKPEDQIKSESGSLTEQIQNEPILAQVPQVETQPNKQDGMRSTSGLTGNKSSSTIKRGSRSRQFTAGTDGFAKVHILVTTSPRTAHLKLNGRVVHNPFDIWATQSGPQRFEASASGYLDGSQTISFDRNQSVVIRLSREQTNIAATRPITSSRVTSPRSTTAKKAKRRTTSRRHTSRSRPKRTTFISENPY